MRPNRAYYHLCVVCGRSVPAKTKEVYCINDGERLLKACPRCQIRITSPYTQFCSHCGFEYRTYPIQAGDAPDFNEAQTPKLPRGSAKGKT